VNQPNLFDPVARATDPVTSHAAAKSVRAGNDDLIGRIRQVTATYGPLTAFEIARMVGSQSPDRWDEGTIRTAIARAELVPAGEGRSPRGRRCITYVYPATQ
jgi:hypothetical protein